MPLPKKPISRCLAPHTGCAAFYLALLGLLSLLFPAHAKEKQIFGALPAVVPATIKADKAADETKDLSEQQFPGGASLKTDPEQQRLLQRAQQCVAEGRLDLAAVLWQKVLDESGDTLMTRDGRYYSSLSEEVERTLRDSGADALRVYRINADGEAAALMAKATLGKERDSLGIIVRRFFLSSYGDDAAYRLACLALDRHDFVSAARLLKKILEQHPDSSISAADILLRLSVAQAKIGDREMAAQALAAVDKMPGPKPRPEVLESVEQELGKVASLLGAGSSDVPRWHMPLGNSQRRGQMPALPAEATSRTLTELWVQETLPPADAVAQNGANVRGGVIMMGGGVFRGGGLRMVRPGVATTQAQPAAKNDKGRREQAVASWKQNKWTPTPQLLFDGQRVFMKTAEDLACFKQNATDQSPLWRSVWRNQYQTDSMSQHMVMMAANMGLNLGGTSIPRSPGEIFMFGDRVHQAMSIQDGVIYSIEGRRVSKEAAQAASAARAVNWGTVPRRARTNFLAAYEIKSGKAKWHRGASDEDKEGSQDVGFLAAPVAYGKLLLVPVTDGGNLWLYALARETGATVWKSYLCDEPSGGCSAWSTVQLAVDGNEAYIAPGSGLVFSVDAEFGTIRWAVRYPRDGKPNQMLRQMGVPTASLLDLTGWDDDVVIPYGRTLLVMASDSDKLLAIDRRTTEILWESPRTSPFGQAANYCLGTAGRGLFVAGKNIVRRYDIPSGRLVWEKEIEDSMGRGIVTSDAVYLPVKNSILKLDLEKGKELIQVGVAMTAEDPVGNLFSDGEKLWVTGGGRVFAMTTLEHRLATLAEQIAAGDSDAQFNRMRLYAKEKKLALAIDDLRGGYKLHLANSSADEAATKLLSAINELRFPRQAPQLVLALLTESFVKDGKPLPLGKEAAAKRQELLATTLVSIRQQKTPGLVESVLAVSPLLEADYLQRSAAQVLRVTARPSVDLPLLRNAVTSNMPAQQCIAANTFALLAPQEAAPLLAKMQNTTDEQCQLAAAQALLNLRSRLGLAGLVPLLGSEKVSIRVRAAALLRTVSGKGFPFSAEGKPEERAPQIAAWKDWVTKESGSVDWAVPLSDVDPPLGRILYTNPSQMVAIELNASHQETWRTKGSFTCCQGLPNGHRLLADAANLVIVEYDEEGTQIWKSPQLREAALSVQRLESGNTLCATSTELIEIQTDGTVTSFRVVGNPVSAQRLPNGNTLVALQAQQSVEELDQDFAVVWEARNLRGAGSAVRLENGNTLVALIIGDKVIELDRSGQKTVWQTTTPLPQPRWAQRLPSGNTLISDTNGIHEVDEAGKKIIWEDRKQGVMGISAF